MNSKVETSYAYEPEEHRGKALPRSPGPRSPPTKPRMIARIDGSVCSSLSAATVAKLSARNPAMERARCDNCRCDDYLDDFVDRPEVWLSRTWGICFDKVIGRARNLPIGERDDFLNALYERVKRNKHRYDPRIAAFATWVGTIAERLAIDWERVRRSQHRALDRYVDIADNRKTETVPDVSIEHREDLDYRLDQALLAILDAIDQLSELEHQALYITATTPQLDHARRAAIIGLVDEEGRTRNGGKTVNTAAKQFRTAFAQAMKKVRQSLDGGDE